MKIKLKDKSRAYIKALILSYNNMPQDIKREIKCIEMTLNQNTKDNANKNGG